MILELIKNTEAINDDDITVILWKFIDENGKVWNTETDINATEEDVKQIILENMLSE